MLARLPAVASAEAGPACQSNGFGWQAGGSFAALTRVANPSTCPDRGRPFQRALVKNFASIAGPRPPIAPYTRVHGAAECRPLKHRMLSQAFEEPATAGR